MFQSAEGDIAAFPSSSLPLGDQIAPLLAERIIFGDLHPGERITEDAVERWFGASRSPVREALRQLERDGLVRRTAHRGVTVTRVDGDQLDDIYRIRVVLEAQAAGLAARRASPAAVRVLEQRLQNLKMAFDLGDPRAYFRANIAFSEAIHAAARNEPLREILRIVSGQAMRFRFMAYQRSEHFLAGSLAGAVQVVDAITRHDEAAAETIIANLLRESWIEIRRIPRDRAARNHGAVTLPAQSGTASGADAVEVEIIREALIAVVNEMRANMIHASYSPIIYEGHDFSCCLMKGDGRQVALGRDDHPLHMLAVPLSTAAILGDFAGRIEDGDMFLHNDPYTGGTHLNDMLMLAPVFIDGRLMFFAAVRSHWNDVGGMTPGSLSGRVTDIYQEGQRVTPTKVVARGEINQAFVELLFSNMRNAGERRGDFDSMLGVCRKATSRLEALSGKFGAERLEAAMQVMLARSEQTMRARIAALPDGIFRAEGFLESNGHTPEPLAIRLALTIAGDEVTADFSGTSMQTGGPTNVGPAMAASSVFSVLKAFLDPSTPINHGAYAPVHVIAPERSFINARLPAPCGGMAEVKFGIDSVVAAALMQVAGTERVGDCKGTANHYHVSGAEAAVSDPFILYEWPAGGTGGIAGMDGNNAMRTYLEGDFNSIQSVEMIEAGMPVRIEELSIREGSCGDGRDRGGFGLRRVVRLLTPTGQLSVLSERNVISPYGADGGLSPWPNRFSVRRGDAILAPSPIPGKVSGFPLVRDDRVVVETSGGGGCGDPLLRDPARVAADVRQGYLTAVQAENRYGVVLGQGRPVSDATTRRRAALANQRVFVRLQSQTHETFEGTRRMLRIAAATAAATGLAPGDVAELVPAEGTPLRVWIACDDGLEPGLAMLGPSSRALLPGAASRLWLRALAEADA